MREGVRRLPLRRRRRRYGPRRRSGGRGQRWRCGCLPAGRRRQPAPSRGGRAAHGNGAAVTSRLEVFGGVLRGVEVVAMLLEMLALLIVEYLRGGEEGSGHDGGDWGADVEDEEEQW